jgi:hypothetical protein
MDRRYFLFLTLIAGLGLPGLSATVMLEPIQDTDVYQFTGTPTSTAFSLSVTPPLGHGLKSAIQFDVTEATVGFGAEAVHRATLRLYVLEPLGSFESFGPGDINVAFQPQAWSETSARWPTLTPGEAIGTLALTAHSVAGQPVWVELDLTAAVKAWLDGSRANHGIVLQSPADGSGASTAFASREAPLDPQATPPQLRIERQMPDADGDGYADADEIAWGSDPQSAASIPVGLTWETEAIAFNTWPGRQYQVRVSSDLKQWQNLGDPVIGDGGTSSVPLPTGPEVPDQWFCRVKDITPRP